MAESEVVVNLMVSQLKIASNAVRDIARRAGTNYALWPHVRELMEMSQLDRIELADFLANSVVRETWKMLGVTRYRVESEDSAERIATATVSVHMDIITIEVLTLNLKGILS